MARRAPRADRIDSVNSALAVFNSNRERVTKHGHAQKLGAMVRDRLSHTTIEVVKKVDGVWRLLKFPYAYHQRMSLTLTAYSLMHPQAAGAIPDHDERLPADLADNLLGWSAAFTEEVARRNALRLASNERARDRREALCGSR